ncbi:hypothetical protein BSKO_06805 [Bryopsis sp. KO-2023]|nr:hypothetical protein BSKO_06805 [Bryopsis sp. KO-2023]
MVEGECEGRKDKRGDMNREIYPVIQSILRSSLVPKGQVSSRKESQSGDLHPPPSLQHVVWMRQNFFSSLPFWNFEISPCVSTPPTLQGNEV